MILKDSINILKPVQTKDTQGRVITTYPVDRAIKGDFQPLKYNTMYKPYGITDKTSNLIFTNDSKIMADYNRLKDDPSQFNATYRIGFNSKQYIIDSILPYRNHIEIYVELVI